MLYRKIKEKEIRLITLFVRRKRGDMTEAYKILTEKENVEKEKFVELSNLGYCLRGHSMKLDVSRPRLLQSCQGCEIGWRKNEGSKAQ